MSVRISLNDLKVRANKIDEFLAEGKRVKIQVQMRGREKSYPEIAKQTREHWAGFNYSKIHL